MSIRQRLSVTTFRSIRFLLNTPPNNQHAFLHDVSSKLSTTCRYSTISLFRSPDYVIRKKSNVAPINNCVSLRYSTDANQITIPLVTYDEVKDLPNHPEKWLIDVREPAELTEAGVIPTSINIPRKNTIFSHLFRTFQPNSINSIRFCYVCVFVYMFAQWEK